MNCLIIEIALLARRGVIATGRVVSGGLTWTGGPGTTYSVRFTVEMIDLSKPCFWLQFDLILPDGKTRSVRQRIALIKTRPHYGGARWWFACPHTGARVSKLYKAPDSDLFVARKILRLGYRSQRVPAHLRAAERLLSLQEHYGYFEDCEAPLVRPNGMWRRTHRKHVARLAPLQREHASELKLLEGY